MSWADIKANGSGQLRLALVIEGWPDIWVTDQSVTLASWSSLQGRNVYAGLEHKGLSISERLFPQEAIPDSNTNTFRIRSVTSDDEALQSFSKRGNRVAQVVENWSDTVTTLGGRLADTSLMSTSTRYHIGTEVFLSGPSGVGVGITRGQWDTTAQAHNVDYFEGTQPVWVYDHPPTMDGRRVALYAFGRTDDATDLDNGTVVWRGVVNRPPRLDSDNLTWMISAEHIVSLLEQTVVGHDTDAKIVGMYHHALAPVAIRLWYNTASSDVHYIADYYSSPEQLAADIDTELALCVIEAGAGLSVDDIRFVWEAGARRFALYVDIGTKPDVLMVSVESPLLHGMGDLTWLDGDGLVVSEVDLRASITFHKFTTAEDWELPPSFPSAMLGGPNMYEEYGRRFGPPLDAGLTGSAFRIYVDRDLSSLVGQAITFEDIVTAFPKRLGGESPLASQPFEVTAAGTGTGNAADVNYIEVAEFHEPNGFAFYTGFLLGPNTMIRPIVLHGTDGNFSDFVESVVNDSPDSGNDGVSPFLTDADIPMTGTSIDWVIEGGVDHPEALQHREYAFYRPVSLAEILRAELQLWGHMLYSNSDGKLDIRSMPIVTEAHPTTKTITNADIVGPGGAGSWPEYTIQAQGLMNTIELFTEYDPREDEWGRQFVVRDADSVATHKNRGRGDMEIKPYSVSSNGEGLTAADAQSIASRYLAFMARDYAAITVPVPFTKFDYLLGDIVKVTSPDIPDGLGGRGVAGRRAFVIGREWPLDPREGSHGELTLWTLLDQPVGYSPSAYVSSEVNDSGDTWTLTSLDSETDNIAVSTAGDGKVLQHFQAGDKVEIRELFASSPTVRNGEVDSVDADNDTITVTFNSTWVPGVATWMLFHDDNVSNDATANQKIYAYVADNNRLLADGAIARRFV